MVSTAAAVQGRPDNIAVRVEDVDFYYGQFRALKSINMEVQRNEVTALIGPSGCGKSTFLRLLNRMNDLIANSSVTGKVIFAGQNIYEPEIDPTDIRRRIGMVFQKPNPFPKSIYNNVAYGPRLHAVKDKETLDQMVVTALKQAAIWDEVKDILHTSAMELSGGQQQRLCIARALAMRPEILLMDEPTSALDPIATARIEELVKDLKNNYTVVIVTHNMQQAARVSDKTAFFYMGELIEFGPTEKLFTKPDQKQTEQYITGRFG